jgi:hypothetical protein
MTNARHLLAKDLVAHLFRAMSLGDEEPSAWPRYVNKALDDWEEKFTCRGPRVASLQGSGGAVEVVLRAKPAVGSDPR